MQDSWKKLYFEMTLTSIRAKHKKGWFGRAWNTTAPYDLHVRMFERLERREERYALIRGQMSIEYQPKEWDDLLYYEISKQDLEKIRSSLLLLAQRLDNEGWDVKQIINWIYGIESGFRVYLQKTFPTAVPGDHGVADFDEGPFEQTLLACDMHKKA